MSFRLFRGPGRQACLIGAMSENHRFWNSCSEKRGDHATLTEFDGQASNVIALQHELRAIARAKIATLNRQAGTLSHAQAARARRQRECGREVREIICREKWATVAATANTRSWSKGFEARRAGAARISRLTEYAQLRDRVARLPANIQPLSLLREFPRIANILARAWPDAPSFAACLDSLLHDRRGGRRGFPGDVQSELLTLRDFIEGRYATSPSALDRGPETAGETE